MDHSSALTQMILPGGVLVASLLGSAHCIGMCGGFVLSFAKDSADVALYHLGRFFSYTLLGALAGALGATFLKTQALSQQLPWLISIFFAIVLIGIGLRRLWEKPLHLPLPKFASKKLSQMMLKLMRGTPSKKTTFALGVLSALLPCGWLYSFVLAATTTKSAALGALSLSFFWLGTVPALSIAPLALNRVTAKIRNVSPKFSGILIIALGLVSLGMHATPLVISLKNKEVGKNQQQTSPHDCPMHPK